MARLTRRSAALVLSGAAAVGVLVAFPTLGHAADQFTFTRFAGEQRYATAAAVADGTTASAPSVVITSGEKFPDAVAAGFVAGLGPAPIILTMHDALPASTQQALHDLGTTSAIVVGGTDAVSAGVEDTLHGMGIATNRIAGTDRYSTAAALATSGGAGVVGTIDGARTAILASGENFPDALSVGGVAYDAHVPTLLTTASTLHPAAAAALKDLGINRVLIAGGTAAVSDAVAQQVTALGIDVRRLAGDDRTGTATAVADYAVNTLGFGVAHVDLASGAGFADALAVGVHSGSTHTPLLLTRTADDIGDATRQWLLDHSDTLVDGHIAGGTSAVSSVAEADAVNAARGHKTSAAASSGGGGGGGGAATGGAASADETTTSTTATPSESTTSTTATPSESTTTSTSTTEAPSSTTTSSTSTTSTTVPGSTTTTSTTSTTVPPSTTTTSTTVPRSTTTTTAPSQPTPPPSPQPCPWDHPYGNGEPSCFSWNGQVSGPRLTDATAYTYDGNPSASIAMIVHYNHAVRCDSLDTSDFDILWTSGWRRAPGWVRCIHPASDGTGTEVLLKLATGSFDSGDTGKVTMKGDVTDAAGNHEQQGDTVSWSTAAGG